jgi:putative methanogenesis marker protein 8
MGAIVRIYEDGSVEIVSKPKVLHCPYMYRVYGIRVSCDDVVEHVVKVKMVLYGLFTRRRRFDFGRIVSFGTSEIISWGLSRGVFDCAVVVCDGAGTVITKSPTLVQGIGAVMNGLLKTYPVIEVVEAIEKFGGIVLDKDEATIDQVKGVLKAVDIGCRRVAVSVIGLRCWEISEIRRIEDYEKIDITIFSTCNTLAKEECVKHIEKADYVCTSANHMLRKALASKVLMQLGVTIPVYILTKKMKDIVLDYIKDLDETLLIRRTSIPYEETYTARCTECEWV